MARSQLNSPLPKSQIKIVSLGLIILFSQPRLKRAQHTRRIVGFAATVFRLINPVASLTFRDIVAPLRDCFTLGWET